MNCDEVKEMADKILGDNKETILQIPLKDLIWTIICYSLEMNEFERGTYMGKSEVEYRDTLMVQKEYMACRRDELARIISQYSDFDTQRVWEVVDEIFPKICFVYNGDEEL